MKGFKTKCYGPKKHEAEERLRKLHNEKLDNMSPSPNILKRGHIK